eukprot:2641878-Prymnesium_polylepis.1
MLPALPAPPWPPLLRVERTTRTMAFNGERALLPPLARAIPNPIVHLADEELRAATRWSNGT